MTQYSNTFGRRKVKTMPDLNTEQKWLYHLNMEYQMGLGAHQELIQNNTGGTFVLSWVCPACDNEHRVCGDWTQVITAQQQLLSMGMAVATAIMEVEVSAKLEMREAERTMAEQGEALHPSTSELLNKIFDKPEGEA